MVTLALTSWNRDSLTFESFRQVLNDERISEIVISDDHSDERIYQNLVFMCNGIEKVKIFRNETNLGCYHNKRKAVELSNNPFVILFDSDNILTTKYLDAIPNTLSSRTIYQPEFARPHFDFTKYSNHSFDRTIAKNYSTQETFCTMLNAMNFLVNREEFLKVFDTTKSEPWTADSIYFNYLWLKAGNSIYVTPGMQYDHLVHNGSHYKNNVHKTGNFYNEVKQMIKEL